MADTRRIPMDSEIDDTNGLSSLPLPPELIERMGYDLDPKSLAQASLVCNDFRLFLHKPLAEAADAHALLQHVMLGEEALARKSSFTSKTSSQHGYWHAVLKKSKGSDPGGRLCEASPLEYAAWAGDTDMVDMFLLELPDEYKAMALEQLRGVKEKGIKTDKGYEKHLSAVKPLIKAYETYRDNFNTWGWTERDKHWIDEIGGKQKCVPIVLLQWFCSGVPFYPVPAFDKLHSRRLKLHSGQSLLPLEDCGLGSKFGVYKAGWRLEGVGGSVHSSGALRPSVSVAIPFSNLVAVSRYCEVRADDLVKQISLLEHELEARQKMEW